MRVPQGAILEPLLFKIYLNDLSEILNFKYFKSDFINIDKVLYADDATYQTNKNDLQENIDTTEEWLRNNKLVLNRKKIPKK